MAIIKCPECGKEISDQSKACVHCGFPLGEKTQSSNETKETVAEVSQVVEPDIVITSTRKKKTKWIVLGIIGVVLIAVIIGLVAFFVNRKDSDENVLASTTKNKREFIGGISLDMTPAEVEKAENYGGIEDDNTYIVVNKDIFENRCHYYYKFDENSRLSYVGVLLSDKKYITYYRCFESLYDLYGTPNFVTYDSDDETFFEAITWNIDNGTVCLGYVGNANSDEEANIIIDYQKEPLTQESNKINVKFHKPQKCSAGSAVGGCNEEALRWSANCKKHSCNVVGCDGCVWDRINGVSLCVIHYPLAVNGTINVG